VELGLKGKGDCEKKVCREGMGHWDGDWSREEAGKGKEILREKGEIAKVIIFPLGLPSYSYLVSLKYFQKFQKSFFIPANI
jgi:hypothetical protein